MTALQQINQGTPPAGSDGDTVRTAFTKVNANTAVLNTQAALTSTLVTSPQALTFTAHVGKRVDVELSADGDIALPLASTCGADNVILLRNIGTGVAATTPSSGSRDTVASVTLKPGAAVLMDTDGVSTWSVLLGGSASSGSVALAGLSDVDESTPPTDGQALVYSATGGKWRPAPVSGTGSATLSGLTDVDESTAPTDGQSLVYSASEGKWKPQAVTGQQGPQGQTGPVGPQGQTGPAGSTLLSGLTDVDESTAPTDGQVLVFGASAGKWKPGTASSVLVNNTPASSDIALAVGQIAYIDVVAATNVPLHIATGDNQLYEVEILARGNTGSNSTYAYLYPNNAALANMFINEGAAWDQASGSITSMWSSGFAVAMGDVGKSTLRVSTTTASKYVSVFSCGYGATAFVHYQSSGSWLAAASNQSHNPDITTPWTSLGMLSFPVAVTGRIIIRRIA